MTQPASLLSPDCLELKVLADGDADGRSANSEAGSRHDTFAACSRPGKPPEPAPLAPLRWRVANMCLCSLAWCCNISAFFVQVTITALLVVELAGTSLSTVPLGGMLVMGFIAVGPLSAAMQRFGIKPVLVGAAVIGLCGALIMVAGAMTSSVATLTGGAFVQGIAFAAGLKYRFVAVQFADDSFGKPKAVAITTLGGALSPVVGPELAKQAQHLFPIKYTGSYMVLCCLYLVAICAAVAIQPQMMVPPTRGSAATAAVNGRWYKCDSLRQTLRSTDFALPTLISGLSYGTMVGLMAATPLAMLAAGLEPDATVVAVQAHILGMYVPSLFTGNLVKAFGPHAMILLGAATMLAANCLYWANDTLWLFALAVALVGVGWNLAFVSTSAAIGNTVQPQDTNALQGVLTFTGAIFSAVGWSAYLFLMLAINGVWTLLAVAYQVRRRPRDLSPVVKPPLDADVGK
eukprot:jgi/Tetstr1/456506/TSEL_043228.t1